jgi:hypothetical protein
MIFDAAILACFATVVSRLKRILSLKLDRRGIRRMSVKDAYFWRPRPGVGVGINVSDIDLAHQIPAVGPSVAGSPSANSLFVELPGRNEVCALFARRIDKRREAR